MKRVLLIVSLISVLLLAGCNRSEKVNNNVNNNVPEVVTNSQQQIETENNISDEKYELINGYVLEDDNYENVNTYNLDEDKKYTFNSDNTEYTIKTVNTEDGEKVYLNNEVINIEGQLDGIFDFDTNDNYKEIITYMAGSIGDSTWIYRVKNNSELELLSEFDNLSLIKIGEKYIFPKYIEFIKEKVPYGYYEFNGDRFLFVDRFLNGEKSTDISEKFKAAEYTTEWTTDHALGPGHFPIYENGDITEKYLADDSKIRILNLKLDVNNNIEFADIELVSDSIISEGRMGSNNIKEIPVEAGTKLTIKFIPVG